MSLFCVHCFKSLKSYSFTIDQPDDSKPDLPLCDECARGSYPTAWDIHESIEKLDPLLKAMLEVNVIEYEKKHSTVNINNLAAVKEFAT